MKENTLSFKQRRQELLECITDLGSRAFNPDARGADQLNARHAFDDLIRSTKTVNLIPTLSLLIRAGQVQVPPWLKSELMRILTLIPLRPDGVRSALEFVFSVHPSSTIKLSEAAVPQKKGANITQEALSLASKLISQPPASTIAETWFSGISGQLLPLLDGDGGPELSKVAAYIIGFGILGNRSLGAPGTPGWKHFAEPMLSHLSPPRERGDRSLSADSNEIVDFSKPRIIVGYSELEKALARLRALTTSHPNPGLCKRLLAPSLLPLWVLWSWPVRRPRIREIYSNPAKELLHVFIRLTASPDPVLFLLRNLNYPLNRGPSRPLWEYRDYDGDHIEIVSSTRTRIGDDMEIAPVLLQGLDGKISALLELIEASCSDAHISTITLHLFKRWAASSRNGKIDEIVIKAEGAESQPDATAQVTELKVLQGMMDKFPQVLAGRPSQVLELVSQIIADSYGAEDSAESVEVALSLLNLIVTEPGFQKCKVKSEVLESIELSLQKLSNSDSGDERVSRTARNIGHMLIYQKEVNPNVGPAPTERQVEDRKTYNLAISYIRQLDAPPPVKVEGLNLISGLISARSPILDVPGISVLLSSLLSDSEDYTNHQVIKIYTQLANAHPKSVTKDLLDHYVDPKEVSSVDTRLHFGEALLQVVERLGETFTGDLAHETGATLLEIAGRRGHRPKTQAKQAREEKLRRMTNKEAEAAWGGDVPDLDSDSDITEEERLRNDIMARIVEGWSGKRGKEDVRIRASALSILSSAFESNIAGLGSSLVSTAVDLCLNTLQLEREIETGILRRAAILLLARFVRALDEARRRRQYLGFGLGAQEDVLRILRYVADTDEDGLVVQHANDVIESLENWQVARMVVPEMAGYGGLRKLAGLAVKPVLASPGDRGSRPGIEEVE